MLGGPATVAAQAAAAATDAACCAGNGRATDPNEKCFKCHDDPEMTAEADGASPWP